MNAPPPWKLIVVSHSHWDREWYFPFEVFRSRLVGMMDQLLDLLDRDPGYRCFMLDGQTIVIDDYLKVRPDRRADVERLARAARLQVGPWYIQPDEFLAGAESLVRNLMWGLRTARQFGEPMMVGYVPDCFGQIAHLPALLRGFGIENAVLWRGADESVAKSEFFWRSPDGSEVLTVHMPDGYGIANNLPVEREALLEAVGRIRETLEPRATTPYLLLMNGSDHMPAQLELAGMIATANEALTDAEMVHGSFPMLFAGIREAMGEHAGARPRYQGEMRSGQRAHVLPGCPSMRVWIKQRNQECEDLLTRWAEPLSLWAALLQKRLGESYREPPVPPLPMSGYPSEPASLAGLLDEAWGELLRNTPHDSICGCSVDQVHEEMRPRFDRCWQIGEELTRVAARRLCAQMPASDSLGLAVFNSSNGPRTDFVIVDLNKHEGEEPLEVIDPSGRAIPCQVLEPDWKLTPLGPVDQVVSSFFHTQVGFVAPDVPGFGYRSFRAVYGPPRPAAAAAGASIENEFLQVTADPKDGTLSVLDKPSGRRLSGLNRFVDDGDRGDEYNYCRLARDEVVDHPTRPPRITVVESGPSRWTLEVALDYSLPAGIGEDRDERSAERVECPILSRVSIYPGLRRIDIHTEVDNRAEDHRLRAHFPAGLQTHVSNAEQHFGLVTRPVALPDWDATWAEEPMGTYAQKSFVDVSDGRHGLMLANRGIPDYEVLPGEREVTIALSMLRCVGYLARFDLTSRPTVAGPPVRTPGAQMLGRHAFDYALIPHEGDWQQAWPEAHRFAVPMRARRLEDGSGGLPAEAALLALEGPAFVVSALKRAENGEGAVVRLYNISSQPASGRVRLAEPFQTAEFVNMEEAFLAEAQLEDGWVRLEARPNQVINLRFRTARL